MIPEEIQRTMDFILRSQADWVVRMDRSQEKQEKLEQNFEKIQQNFEKMQQNVEKTQQNVEKTQQSIEKTQQDIDALIGVTRDHLVVTRQLLETSRLTTTRLDRSEDLIVLLTRIAESHSNRLDRLEK